jgi:signal transduction histidine kinase
MRRPAGIRRKIWVVFVLQLAAISFATVVGVYGAATILEDLLIKQALKDEAQHYFGRLRSRPTAELPDTYNLRGYLISAEAQRASLPEDLRGLSAGYHHVRNEGQAELVYVSKGDAGWLFLVFRQEQVHKLAFLFGFVPLTVVLLIIYLTTWLTYRASRRALSPIIGLASVVRDWDPKKPDLQALDLGNLPGEADHDVEVLSRALHSFATRIDEFIERERNFTRDASHELRSPLTVIKLAADVLEDDEHMSAFARRSARRIRAATRDMEALIEAFLILARESDTGLPEEDFLISELVADEVEQVRPLLENKPVNLVLRTDGDFCLHASPRVLSVVIGNLLRNACLYTEHGRVVVTIGHDSLRVEDTGVGMSDDELAHVFQPFYRAPGNQRGGHGVGLTIVKRLSDRFSWPLEIHSVLGQGTVASVQFPAARKPDRAAETPCEPQQA